MKTSSVEEAVAGAMKKIVGAYSLVVMSPRKMIGARDPFGFKPLCIGKRDNAYILVSESCALDTIGAEFVRDVKPGEIVTITKDGIASDTRLCFQDRSREARCVFEYIYFARPDSVFDGVSVYQARILAGRALAVDSPVEADLVVGVPESGNGAALGYSMESQIPYGTAFVKNSYVGRTFIKPKQSSRESAVRIKLNVLKEAVAGKRVIMIDDSIVRGTTSALIVGMLREAGADFVTVFQETYDLQRYGEMHVAGAKRCFPYRVNAQERALMGGMRGVGFGALLGLDDFRKDAFATGYHAYLLQRKYPHAEIAFSCPRLRPIINNDRINPMDVHEPQLLQVVCAYRLFMPFASITVSTRECARVRDNLVQISATKISAGVSTGIGSHVDDIEDKGDDQFEISDGRSVDEVYQALLSNNMQPVMSDYIYV